MDKFNIENVLQIKELSNEMDLEKATTLQLRLRWMIRENKSLKPAREHLRNLIKKYEKEKWSQTSQISEKQIQESDNAEELVKYENNFIRKRKDLIRKKLNEYGLKQQDLAKILGHRDNYMSELINGVRSFSKDDIVVIHRLLKIKLEYLIPPFIEDEKARHIKNTLSSLKKSKIKLVIKDLDLEIARP